MKIAVIGTGASAYGVTSALLPGLGQHEITYYDTAAPEPARQDTAEPQRVYDDIYSRVVAQDLGIPAEKTYFGERLDYYDVDGIPRLFRADQFGGQTKLWGASCLPLTIDELADLGLTRQQLDPHYAAIASQIGIAGTPGELGSVFGDCYQNRPATTQLTGFARLQQQLNRNTEDYAWTSAPPPVAVDTRLDGSSGCNSCGECMVGCLRGAIFSSEQQIKDLLKAGRATFVCDRVKRIDTRSATPAVITDSRRDDYDLVFVAAGCLASTAIAARSANLGTLNALQDNAIYQVPVFNFGAGTWRANEYFGLTNLISVARPHAANRSALQIQWYANVDYILRSFLPGPLWTLVNPLVRASRDRAMFARIYLDAPHSYAYQVNVTADDLTLTETRTPDKKAAGDALKALRQALGGSLFWAPPGPMILAPTSAHLAGPLSGAVATRDGKLAPGVYVADSSTFAASPVSSPTFTIMANARRIAADAMENH